MSKLEQVIIGKVGNGQNEDSFFAMLETEANRAATLWAAINSAQTWGDFRSQCGPHLWNEVVNRFEDCEASIPEADCQFESTEIPGFEDGDWPRSPQTSIKDWLPISAVPLLRQFETVHNGVFFEFNADDKEILIAILKEEGFVCIENDALIQRACGIDVESNSTKQPKLGIATGMMRKKLLSKISAAEILIAETILDLRKLKAEAESVKQRDLKNSIDSPLLQPPNTADQFRNLRFMEIDRKKKKLADESNQVEQVCKILKELEETKLI